MVVDSQIPESARLTWLGKSWIFDETSHIWITSEHIIALYYITSYDNANQAFL